MAVSVKTSGSQTATVPTEHTLATITDPGTYTLEVDLSEMVDGTTPDIVQIKIYGKARTSDTERLREVWEFIGGQGKPLWGSIPIMSPHHFKATLNQLQGTSRAFPWAVYTP